MMLRNLLLLSTSAAFASAQIPSGDGVCYTGSDCAVAISGLLGPMTMTYDECRNSLLPSTGWVADGEVLCVKLGTCHTLVGCNALDLLTVGGVGLTLSSRSSEDHCEVAAGASWLDLNLGSSCVEFGSVAGDPHFKTFQGHKYDYQGECDLVLVHNPTFANGVGLDIHIRTTRLNFFSFVESVAIKIGNEVLEIDNKATFRIGDTVGTATQNDFFPMDFSGYSVFHDVLTKNTKQSHFFKLVLDETLDEAIKIHIWDMFIGVTVDHRDHTSLFEGSAGMMGDFATGDMIARDGISVVEDSGLFASEWQVRRDGTDPVLFRENRAPIHPRACFLPEKTARELVSEVTLKAAQHACEHWGESGMKNCVYDVIATGNLEIADAEVY